MNVTRSRDSAIADPTPGAPKRSARSQVKLGFRIAVSLVLLTIVYLKVDFQKLGHTLSALSIGSVFLLLGLYSLGQLLSGLKWHLFVRKTGIAITPLNTLRAYLFGMFVNSIGFGLGTVGGDVARAIAIFPERGKRAAAFGTVLADRFHGLGILLAIGVVATLIVQPEQVPLSLLLLAVAGAAAIGVGWLFGPWLLMKIFPEDHKFGGAAISVARAFPRTPRTVVLASVLSTAIHSLQILMHVVMARELGATLLTPGHLFATVPYVNAASSLPISYNGIGVREFMYSWLFAPLASAELSVAFGAIWVVAVSVVGILGGLLLPPEMRSAARSELARGENVIKFPTEDRRKSHESAAVDAARTANGRSD